MSVTIRSSDHPWSVLPTALWALCKVELEKRVRLDSCPHARRHYLQPSMMGCRTRGPGLGTRAEMNMGIYIAKSAGFLSSRSGLLCSVSHVTPESAALQLLWFPCCFLYWTMWAVGQKQYQYVCFLIQTYFILNKNAYTTFLYKQTTWLDCWAKSKLKQNSILFWFVFENR